jgi:triosephosphate isomerase
MIALNLKTYDLTIQKSLFFADVAREVMEESDVRIIVCPPAPYLREAAGKFYNVFAQHVDSEPPGAFTGSIPVEMLKAANVKGSLVNHSEKRIAMEKVKTTVERLQSHGLESLVCAATPQECASIAHFSPTFIAVEPPELIGSGVSVSKSKPEIVISSVRAVKGINPRINALCGAGVSDRHDVKKALELGSEGVLLASAFVKAKDPKAFLADLASVF